MKFLQYFTKNIIISGTPTIEFITENNFHAVINVSCQMHYNIQESCLENQIPYFWFPMNEHSIKGDIGINSMYGALSVLHKMYQDKKRVLLHCHAGSNRSPTVLDAFFYMNCGYHKVKSTDMALLKEITEMMNWETAILKQQFFEKESKSKNNRLITNCEIGHLPALPRMESFLRKLHTNLCENKSNLEEIKIKSEI